jgi:hypothetical protein
MASLGAQIRDFDKFLGERQARAINRIIRECGKRIIMRSPIDTGLFVSNWFYDHTSPSPKVTTRTGGTVVNDLDLIPLKPQKYTHFITNNLDYAWALETGWSGQAPYGIVGLLETDFQGIVERVALEIDR